MPSYQITLQLLLWKGASAQVFTTTKQIQIGANGDGQSIVARELFYSWQYGLTKDDALCKGATFLVHECGCTMELWDTMEPYLFNSRQQYCWLVWITRVILVVLLIGSSLIFYHILHFKRQKLTFYYQMMLLVAIFDAITSLVWLVGLAALDKFNSITQSLVGIYSAKGNAALCTASGFFWQLGKYFVYLYVFSL